MADPCPNLPDELNRIDESIAAVCGETTRDKKFTLSPFVSNPKLVIPKKN